MLSVNLFCCSYWGFLSTKYLFFLKQIQVEDYHLFKFHHGLQYNFTDLNNYIELALAVADATNSQSFNPFSIIQAVAIVWYLRTKKSKIPLTI